jgi:hypothetical protein
MLNDVKWFTMFHLGLQLHFLTHGEFQIRTIGLETATDSFPQQIPSGYD